MSVRILEGDALQVLQTLPDCSVQCCVTSPPYFGLRDYGTAKWDGGDESCDHVERTARNDVTPERLAERAAIYQTGQGDGSKVSSIQFRKSCGKCGARATDQQMGLEKTPDLYVEAMVGVFREVKRVLRDDGTLWLNIGDSYAGYFGAQSRGKPGAAPLSAKQGSGRAPEVWGTGRPVTAKVDGCKPKDLIGIPWMLAFALRADGWYLRSDIIWHKPNPMPESVTDRPTKSHEYLFLLSKSDQYFYDADAIREASEDVLGTERFKGRGGISRPDYEPNTQGWNGTGLKHTYRDYTRGRNKRSVWTVPTSPYSEAHFATFPPKLIEPCILAGSAKQACEKCGAPWGRTTESVRVKYDNAIGNGTENQQVKAVGKVGSTSCFATGEGNVRHTTGFSPTCDCENSGTGKSLVLDPFGGAGTTGLVADRLGRDALLIELNPKYAEMARRRIHSDNPLFGDVA